VSDTLTERVTEHVRRIGVGDVNLFLILLPESLTLVDAGFPGTMALLDEAVRSLGRRPQEIRDVLVTHCHPDHAAGLAEIKEATGAQVWMHPADAEMVRAGKAFRPFKTAPGLRNFLFVSLVVKRSPSTFDPAAVDREVSSGETIPAAGGIKALGTPGHTAGHLVFLWPGDGGVLFVGDAASHRGRLRGPRLYEDKTAALESLHILGRQEFEVACFAHGAPIVGAASQEFGKMWGPR
jgi:glyoxylase-like metal-dependent hydrolase (beta-lactamase superfamily II)